ncbi:endo-1,4-beta-mannosidase [Sporothrix brasiliensis 5110]|uniref:Mannan endo-1,4-beta-mannosidase A n=1 Tax=Sporothrix brasiliensis 5110 TaxID=1398154 RepID=A0A0C2IPG2_9PEZI|nr:endo-1,4-beta-mannosidase [Sporothrix brasiliensis 5110]KIH88810.1 endo-1,4-beta-mannosidase [Sporothrix brasiliensis 5110]
MNRVSQKASTGPPPLSMMFPRLTSLFGIAAVVASLLAGTILAAPSKLGRATSGIPTTKGLRFSVDGDTKYLSGSNSYWIGFLSNTFDVDLVLDHVSSSGLKVLRIWGFNDVTTKPSDGTVYFQYLSSSGSQINTGANGLQRLDYVVEAAAQRGVYLIVNFVNNWGDYGGIPAYTSVFGGTAQEWYDNAAAQAQYRAYIKAVVTRYTNASSIFAWELANEPRCNGCSTDAIYNWATSTSQYIKSLDPHRMVTLGDEGMGLTPADGASSYPYTTAEGVDFVKNLGIATLDFGTFHMYPSSWGVDNSFGPGWIADHAAACKAAGKPCLLEEYGTTTDHCAIETPWQRAAVGAANDGLAADLFWQWGDLLSTGRSPDDGNTIYYGSSDATCLITDHVRAIDS